MRGINLRTKHIINPLVIELFLNSERTIIESAMKRKACILVTLLIPVLVFGQVKVINTLKLYDSPDIKATTGITIDKGTVLEIGNQSGDYWEILWNNRKLGYLHKD